MQNKLSSAAKSFLLGPKEAEFEFFFNKSQVEIPESWLDFYFKNIIISPADFNELTLIKKYLKHSKFLVECFFDAEIPRRLQESCQILAKSLGASGKINFSEKLFKKDWIKKNGSLDVISNPFYLRDKILALDDILRKDFNQKIYFIFGKKVYPPYEIGSVGSYIFTLREKDTEFFLENEEYSIGDCCLIQEDFHFQNLLKNGYRYLSSSHLGSIARKIQQKSYQPQMERFLLGDGAIAIFQSLYPQLPLISFANKEWDNSIIRIFRVENGEIHHSNRVEYGLYLWNSFLRATAFNNSSFVVKQSEVDTQPVKLLIKFSENADPVAPFTRAEAEELLAF